jgi:hypothetical protein
MTRAAAEATAATAIAAAEEAAAVAAVRPPPPTDTIPPAAEAVAELVGPPPPSETMPLADALVETDEPDKRQVTIDEDTNKYKAILEKTILEEYSESKDTVFLVNLENNTVGVAAEASISQYPEEGLERIQEEVEVIIDGKPFTITAITDVNKELSEENKIQIRGKLKGLVAAIQDDKEFHEKLKEASDLKDGLIELKQSFKSRTDLLEGDAFAHHSKESEIKDTIDVLNQALGNILLKNLKKLEKSTNKKNSIRKRIYKGVFNKKTIPKQSHESATLGTLDKLKPSTNKESSILKRMYKSVFNGKTMPQNPPPPLDTIPAAETAAVAAEIPLEPGKAGEPLEEVLKEELDNKPDMGYKEIHYLTDKLQNKINDLEVLNKALGDKLSDNLKTLEKSTNKESSILKRMYKSVFNGKTMPQQEYKLVSPFASVKEPDFLEVPTPSAETPASAAETAAAEAAKIPAP